MNEVVIKGLELIQKNLSGKLNEKKFGLSYDGASFKEQEASDIIKEKLLGPSPVMIGRLGYTELHCILNYQSINQRTSFPAKAISYIKGNTKPFWWTKEVIWNMVNLSGFFPASEELLEKFAVKMLQDMQTVDMLGSWLREEQFLSGYFSQAVKVRLRDLEPYYHADPWTVALANKTVLVIHPFTESIESQYKKRESLFVDNRILPAFKLKTIKAVQSIADNKTKYQTWFEALDDMCIQISNTDFDIAILGCGAYGFPIAAHIKRIGKKAVHLGGATQILFGIMGKRWENHSFISKLVNEHWIRPSQNEVPQNFTRVEEGCYW